MGTPSCRSTVGMGLAVLVMGVTPIVAASAAVSSARPALASTPVARTAATVVRRVTPLDRHGHLRSTYKVAATARGYCWTASFVNGRAYRCLQRNHILDPCWKERGRRSVVCLLLPWSAKVTRLRLTRRLPDAGNYGGAIWGLRLGSGINVNCLVSTGAGGWIGNRHISYYCRRGWVLLNEPNRRHAVWTIGTAKRAGRHYELRGRKSLLTAWVPVVHAP
jgi:hypothetical protein